MSRRVVLWIAFVVVHVAVGVLGYHEPSQPMGDVYLVYEPWSGCALFGAFSAESCPQPEGWQFPGITERWIYPQLALIPMLLSWAFAWAVSYTPAWAITVSLADLVAFSVLVGRGRSRGRVLAAWFWLAGILLVGPAGLYRIDGFTVPLAIVGSLWLVRRPFMASILLSIAVWMKVWPAAILAAALVAVRRRLQLVWGAVAVSLGTMIPVIALGGGAYVLGFVGDQTTRGIQMEAPVAAYYMFLASLGSPNAAAYWGDDVLTWQATGPGVGVLVPLMTPILLLALLGILVLGAMKLWRGATYVRLFPPLALALVAGFIVLNKVGSPQYYVWLFVPVVIGLVIDRRRWIRPAVLTLAISACTQIMFPFLYEGLMKAQPDFGAVVVLELRNLLVAVLFVWAIVDLARVPGGRVARPADLYELVTGRRRAVEALPARVPAP